MPLAVVRELGPPSFDPGFLVGQVALQREVLQVSMCRDQRQRGRNLVELARLDADQAVLDHVDPSEPVATGDPPHLRDELGGSERRSVQRHGHTALE